ncbi:MAG: hypothetical protein ACE148_17030 [Vicinamibacterales bacterium]
MSTVTYALMTSARRGAAAASAVPEEKTTEVSAYVRAMAALVPAEVLTLHALMLSVTTETFAPAAGGAAGTGASGAAIRITDPRTLSLAFFGLMATSIVLYAVPKLLEGDWVRLDFARAAIPPLAFVAWTMLQRATAFDAVWAGLADAPRTVAALFLAVSLGLAARALG